MTDPTPARKRNQAKPLPSLEILDEWLIYEPETGVIRWRKLTGGKAAGSIAGHMRAKGYRSIYVQGSECLAHRLAFKMYHRREPESQIDHRDTDPSNNRISNLREASNQGNSCNMKIKSCNTSGVKGVCWDKRNGKWKARVRAYYKVTCVGQFKTLEEAEAAVRSARERLHGEFTHHG